MAQDKPPEKEAAAAPRKTFADYARAAGSGVKNYVMDPQRLPSIGAELAYAVNDIRQKVIEEGVYGRAVTPDLDPSDRDKGATPGPEKKESPKGDPLGRTQLSDGFKKRLQEAARRGGSGPERGQDRGAERGPER